MPEKLPFAIPLVEVEFDIPERGIVKKKLRYSYGVARRMAQELLGDDWESKAEDPKVQEKMAAQLQTIKGIVTWLRLMMVADDTPEVTENDLFNAISPHNQEYFAQKLNEAVGIGQQKVEPDEERPTKGRGKRRARQQLMNGADSSPSLLSTSG